MPIAGAATLMMPDGGSTRPGATASQGLSLCCAEAAVVALGHFGFVASFRNVHADLRHDAVNRIGHEQTAGLEPPLARADLADVGDFARAERQAVERVHIAILTYYEGQSRPSAF